MDRDKCGGWYYAYALSLSCPGGNVKNEDKIEIDDHYHCYYCCY